MKPKTIKEIVKEFLDRLDNLEIEQVGAEYQAGDESVRETFLTRLELSDEERYEIGFCLNRILTAFVGQEIAWVEGRKYRPEQGIDAEMASHNEACDDFIEHLKELLK